VHRAPILLVLLAFALGLPAQAAAGTTLFGSVNGSFEIALESDGQKVTYLPAGIYTIIVTDSTSGHNFHLRGPGVDEATPIANGSAGTVVETWVVTLTSGVYDFNCDRHPGSMWGSFTVGDVLSVSKTGNGSGTVASLPPGISCGWLCLAAFPVATPVTLNATPAGNSEFVGWGGACSGILDCALAVTGYVSVSAQFRKLPPPPPPPPDTSPPPPVETPATLKSVVVRRVKGMRTIRITLAVTRHTGGKVALRRKGSTVTSKALHVAPGIRLVRLRAPRSAGAGVYTLRLTLTDSLSGARFVVRRTVRL
jgi:hypothetical protein